MPATPPHRADLSLNDVARQLVPHLRIISGSQPVPLLREHNVLAVCSDPEVGRRAVLSLEAVEHADDQLGTVVMGSGARVTDDANDGSGHVDPEGVTKQVVPRALGGGLVGALVGAVVVACGALLFGATGWELVGAAAAGAMLFSVFGAIWLTFAGFGGSDAYRQTFVDQAGSELTIVSVHTDDRDEAAAVKERLAGEPDLRVLVVNRLGQVTEGSPPSSNTQ